MTNCKKWTVRNLDSEAFELLSTMKTETGWTYGDLLSEAISEWYENLPETEDE